MYLCEIQTHGECSRQCLTVAAPGAVVPALPVSAGEWGEWPEAGTTPATGGRAAVPARGPRPRLPRSGAHGGRWAGGAPSCVGESSRGWQI